MSGYQYIGSQQQALDIANEMDADPECCPGGTCPSCHPMPEPTVRQDVLEMSERSPDLYEKFMGVSPDMIQARDQAMASMKDAEAKRRAAEKMEDLRQFAISKGMMDDETHYDASEQDVLMQVFESMLRSTTKDGGRKRAAGLKPPWWKDDAHEAAIWSHINKWKHGEIQDPDSGVHPLVHAAWRMLAIAYQETYGRRDPVTVAEWSQ